VVPLPLLVPPPAPSPVVVAPVVPLLRVAPLVPPITVDAAALVVALVPALVPFAALIAFVVVAFVVVAFVVALALVVLLLPLVWAVWVVALVAPVWVVTPRAPPLTLSVVDWAGEPVSGSDSEHPFRRIAVRRRGAAERSIVPRYHRRRAFEGGIPVPPLLFYSRGENFQSSLLPLTDSSPRTRAYGLEPLVENGS
jgi:hypothetical protein